MTKDSDEVEEPSNTGSLTDRNSGSIGNRLPFSRWWIPLLAGAAAGIILRFVFSGEPGNPYATMLASFVYFAPLLVGATTVYVAERTSRRTWGYYFSSAFLANFIFVAGTLLILVEGLICAILIIPLFSVVGGFGGLLMGAVCRLTNWPKNTLYTIGALPLLLGGVEAGMALPEQFGTVEKSIAVAAPPSSVWNLIMHAEEIERSEVGDALVFRIGAPMPHAGVLVSAGTERKRRITMGKEVYFDQIFTAWEENKFIDSKYKIYNDSIPPHALDDHVMVGGHYFDVTGTSYKLTPTDNGTDFIITISYRVSTNFNWYAEPIVRYLMGDLTEILLKFYKRRAEYGSLASTESAQLKAAGALGGGSVEMPE